jgi:manganese/zinc/iron transport system permease protein
VIAAQRLDREHVLRALFECGNEGTESVDQMTLQSRRSWHSPALRRALRRLIGESRVTTNPTGRGLRLTASGLAEARRIVRNHRLWELYLIEHAAVAPGRVDRDADLIEHALDPAIVQELEDTLDKIGNPGVVPANPEASA